MWGYTDLSTTSPLRKLVVRLAVQSGSLDEWELDKEAKEFLVDLIYESYARKNNPLPIDFWKSRCDYHVHPEGEP